MAKKGTDKPADPETIAAAQSLADQGKGADAEAQGDDVALQQSALDRLEAAIDEKNFNSATLVADVTEAILELFKRRPKSWAASSPAEQRDVMKVIEFAARTLVKNAVTELAAAGRPSIRAVLDGIAIGDKVTGKFKLAAYGPDEMAKIMPDLYAANKKSILIIVADFEQFNQGGRDHVGPDEPELPMAGEDDDSALQPDGDPPRDPAADPDPAVNDADGDGAGDDLNEEEE